MHRCVLYTILVFELLINVYPFEPSNLACIMVGMTKVTLKHPRVIQELPIYLFIKL